MQKIVQLSRPRFWLYVLGPFLVGVVLAAQDISFLADPVFWFSFVFFLLFANIFLYGVNDISDRDTDEFNKKKKTHEYFFVNKDKIIVYGSVLVSVAFSLLLVPMSPATAVFFLGGYLLLGAFYSLPPIRFKAKPIIDSLSNVLYVMPGFYGFALYSDAINYWLLIPLGAWTAAMHLYSAIPDIVADKKAKVYTTATLLGHKKSLYLCAIYWLVCAGWLTFYVQQYPTLLLAYVYPVIPLILVHRKKKDVSKFYWYFPIINAIVGGIAFFTFALQII